VLVFIPDSSLNAVLMRAIILNAEEKSASVSDDVAVPKPGPGDVLVRVSAIALNPVDALYVSQPLGATGRVVGSDFAGTVVESVNNPHIPVGQRVAGFVQGACSVNDRPGAFAEYVVCPADLVWLVPDDMPLEQAAAVSLCGLTAAQGLIYRLELPSPFPWEGRKASTSSTASDTPLCVFVYGASTSVGMYAAQIIRQSCETSGRALQLIGAASKGRFDLLRAAPYHYDSLVDYREPDWPAQVRTLTGSEGVDLAYDCISEGQTVKLVSSTLREGGRLAIVRSRQGGAWSAYGDGLPTEPVYGAVWEGLGVDVQYQGLVVRSSKETRDFAGAFYRWLAEGKLEANPIRVMPGGLDRVVCDGLALLGPGTMDNRKNGRSEEWMKPISAEKLVYQI
jgi:NADPH:quinone reductase-like Zn-dependent oxidoreductase